MSKMSSNGQGDSPATTVSTNDSTFKRLAALDCKPHIEKKGKYSYLSWPWAVGMLREADPKATWEVRRFDGLPFMATACGHFVEVAVTVDGVTLSQIHPVLNEKNKPIEKPDAFDINTSIQRCLVKAIALHGLGLYIYAGEDLPSGAPDAASMKEESLTRVLAELAGATTIEDLRSLTKSALQIAAAASDTDAHKRIKAHAIELGAKFAGNGAAA